MIYVASKSKHAAMWRSYRERYPITSTWIDEAEKGQTRNVSEFWSRCLSEVADSNVLILYTEEGETQKGALVEVGAALASGVFVLVVGPVNQTWIEHPLVTRAETLTRAFERAASIIRSIE